MEWTTALPDWEQRLLKGHSLVPCGPLFPDVAAQHMAMFDRLRITEAAGQPTFGQSTRPWVRDFCETLFGSLDPESGERLINTYFLLVPKKNGKSLLSAGVMLTALLANWREGAEFLIIAPTLEAARNAYLPAEAMVRADPSLGRLLHSQSHLRTITHRKTKATLHVVSAANEAVAGKKATGVLIDELWEFGSKADGFSILTEATGGLASRPEGFVLMISTQGSKPPAGVFRANLDMARAVRDGKLDNPKFLPVLHEFPQQMVKDKAFLNPDNFALVNPNMGLSVSGDFLRQRFAEAQAGGTEALNNFLCKHLNVEIDVAMTDDSWSGAMNWADCADTSLTLESLIERSDVVVVGLDGGGLDDLFGVAVVGREADTGHWLAWTRAYAHRMALQRHKGEAERLRDFAAAGDLIIAERHGEDVDDVVDLVLRVEDSGKLDLVAVDQAGIAQTVEALHHAGIDEDRVVGVSQGWRMTSAIKGVERRLLDGTMRHTGTAMMNWCVANARVKPVGNAVAITKELSGAGKIDPLMAMFNACMALAQNPEPKNVQPQAFDLEAYVA